MKHFMKRGLALLLAMVLTLSLLPTAAFAAPTEERFEETVEGGEKADAAGKTDEQPVDPLPDNPEDPDDPVDPDWSKWTIEITNLTEDGEFEVTVKANGEGNTGSATTGGMGFIIVPNLKRSADHTLPADMTYNTSNSVGTVTGGKDSIADHVEQYSGMTPKTYYSSSMGFTMPATGEYKITGTLPSYDTIAAELLLRGALTADGTPWKDGQAIPFVAVLVTQEGSVGSTKATANMPGNYWELVAEPGAIQTDDSTSKFVFTLDKAEDSQDCYVDYIGFTDVGGSGLNSMTSEDANNPWSSGVDGNTEIGSISVSQSAVGANADGSDLKSFANATGYITVLYHRVDGNENVQKTLTISVQPVGTISGTPIVVTAPYSTSDQSFENLKSNISARIQYMGGENYDVPTDADVGFVTNEGLRSAGFLADIYDETTAELVPTPDYVYVEGAATNADNDIDVKLAEGWSSTITVNPETFEATVSPTPFKFGQVVNYSIADVKIPGNTAPGTYAFTLTIPWMNSNGQAFSDPGYFTEPLRIPLTVIVEQGEDFTATFNPNGGTFNAAGTTPAPNGLGMVEVTITEGTKGSLTYTISRAGYTFQGWAKGADTNPLVTGWPTAATGTINNNIPAETAMYYAVWGAADVTVTVTATLDGNPLPAGYKVTLGGKDMTTTDRKSWTLGVAPGASYDIAVSDGTSTLAAGSTGTVAVGSAPTGTVELFTAGVKTDGNGSATVSAPAAKALGSNTATSSNATAGEIIVLKGTAVTWTAGTASTYYQFSKWDDNSTNTTLTLDSIAAKTEHTANFVPQTATVTVTLNLDRGATGATTLAGRDVVLSTSSTSATTGQVTTTAAAAGVYTTAALPQSATTTYYVWAKDYAGNYQLIDNTGFTVTGAVTKAYDYYTAKVTTDGNGSAKMTIGGTDFTATNTTGVSKALLKGTAVTWDFVGPTDSTKYRSYGWDDTTSTAQLKTTGITAPITHEAKFMGISKVAFVATPGSWAGGAPTDANQTGDINTAATAPTTTPTRDGYKFAGWGTTTYTFPNTPGDTTTYTAVWTKNTATVTVHLDTGTYTAFPGTLTLKEGSNVLTASGSNGVYTFGELIAGKTYDIVLNGTTTVGTVATMEGGDAKGDVRYYTAEAVTSGNGTATVTEDATPTNTATTSSAANNKVSIIVLAGAEVTWTYTEIPATNYTFVEWQNAATGGTATIDVTSVAMNAKTTRKAVFGQGTFDGKVYVTWDGNTPSGTLSANVTVNGKTYTVKNGTNYVEFKGLLQGTDYDITVDGHATGLQLKKDNLSETVDYIPVIAATGGNGTVTVTGKDAGGTAYAPAAGVTTAAAAGSKATLWVLDGAKVSWTSTPAAYYKHKQWEDAETGGTVTTDVTDQVVSDSITRKAIFEQKTSTVKVVFHVDNTEKTTGRDVVIRFNGGTPQTVASGTTSHSFTGVNQQATAYSVNVDGIDYGTVTVSDAANGSTVTYVVDFATATVKTGGNGDASVEAKYGTVTLGPVSTDYQNGTMENKIVVLKGQTATWKDGTAAPNYAFKSWDNAGGNDRVNKTATMGVAEVPHTAYFSQISYVTYLKVSVNGANQTNAEVGPGKDITAVKFGSTAATYDTAAGSWKAVVSMDSTDKWAVSTITGDYPADNAGEGNVTTLALYGVKTADKSGRETKRADMTANGTANQNRVLVELNDWITVITAYPANGYTSAGWTVDNAANGETVDFANKRFRLTKAVTADVVLTPTFTYEVPVELHHGSATGPLKGGQTVTITALDGGAAATVANKSGTNTGEFKISGMSQDKTYRVVVNGYETKLVLDDSMASTTTAQKVILYKVSVEAYNDTDSAVGGGTATISNTNEVFIPEEAKPVDLALKAAATNTATSHFRPADSATNTGDKDLWTIETAGSGAALANKNNTTTATVSIPDPGIKKDVALRAHFVKQWKITTRPNTGASTTAPTVTSGVGSVAANIATVDNGGIVKVTATPSVDQQVKSWSITGGEGKLYEDAACTTVMSAGYKGTEVYVKALTADATVTATFEDREYRITVQVNKNNDEWGSVAEVRLNKKGGSVVAGAAGKVDANGVKTFDMIAGEYDVWANSGSGWENTGKVVKVSTDTAKNVDKATLNYYDVDLKAAPAGTTGKQNTVNFTGEAASTDVSKIVLAKTGAKVDIGATAFAGTAAGETLHYRFQFWTKNTTGGSFGSATTTAGNSYTLPTEAELTATGADDAYIITDANKITLTADFRMQFRVTVAKAPAIAGESDLSNTYPKVSASAVADWDTYSSANTSVLVDSGNAANIAYSGGDTKWYFKEWSRAANTGTFNTGSVNGTTLGTKKGASTNEYSTLYNAPNTFTPTADSTLYADFWKNGQLDSAAWTYTQGNAAAGDNSAANQNQLGWTPNDAQTPTITVTGRAAGSTAHTLTAADYDTSTSGGKTIYTLKTSYLDGLAPDDIYDVEFSYQLGTAGANNSVVYNLTQSTLFDVKLKKFELTDVQIKVKDGSATLNVDSTGTQDVAEWESHQSPNIDPLNKLTLKWYYTTEAKKPTSTTVPATLPTEWIELTTGATNDFTGTGTTYTAIPNYDGGGNTAIQGMYVFAIAEATGTGTGKVVTEAIPVNYTGKVVVNVDDTPITSDPDRFVVYLRPVPVTGTPSTANTVQTGDIPATWNNTDRYETADSALTGGVKYQVWVNERSTKTAGADLFLKNTGKVISGSPTASQTAEVDFYTVNLTQITAANAAAKVTHTTDNAGAAVGETFTGYPVISAAVTGTARDVTDGMAVLTGTNVTATTTTWNQDYTLTWEKSTGNTAPAPTANKQASGATAATFNNGPVEAKTNIGANLDQNVYTITGDISGSGKLVPAPGVAATLTVNSHTFDGTSTYGTQGKDVVTFRVPTSDRTGAINGKYTIAATAAAGSTVQGYDNKSATTRPTPSNTDVTVDGVNNSGRFTIFVDTTNLRLELKDEDAGTTGHIQSSANPNTTITVTHTEDTLIFANYKAFTKTVTVTNKGNTPLTITMGIQEGTNVLMKGDTTLTGDDADQLVVKTATNQDITFGKLEKSFTLGLNESREFTITVPKTLKVKDNTTYTLTFDAKDGRDNTTQGPKMNYDLTIIVKPVTIADVTTTYDAATDTYTMATTVIKEDKEQTPPTTTSYDALQKPTSTQAAQADDDLVYKWYYADWDADVELKNGKPVDKATGNEISPVSGTPTNNGLSYTPVAGERGKSLYLVVTGKGNATGAAMTPDRTKGEQPIIVSYGAEIRVYEGVTATANLIAADTGYEVYLWRAGTGNFDKDDPKAIPTTWDATSKSFKTADTALYPCDPDTAVADKAKWTYEVYTNVVKGSDQFEKVNGVTIEEEIRTADVNYYSVALTETTYDNGKYDGPLKGTAFFTDTGHKTDITPTAKVGTIDVATTDTNKWVRKGQDVTVTEAAWTKDYTLAWTNATAQGAATPAAGGTAKIASIAANTTVDTKLTLNLYTVTAEVKGMGMVSEITMTMGKGTADEMVFSTLSATGKILGINTASTGIAAGSSVDFILPSGTYTTEAFLPVGSAANLQKYVHGATDVTYDADNGKTTIDIAVTGPDADSYEVWLAGDGLLMPVKDNVTTAADGTGTKKRYTKLEGSGSSQGSISGDTVIASNATRTIYLNYNYNEDLEVEVDVSNNSKTSEGADQILKNVTFTADPSPKGITCNANDFAGGPIATLKTGDPHKTIKLTIPKGLDVADDYQYTATFSFQDDTGKTATVQYILTVKVLPLAFSGVNVGNAGGVYSITDYTVTREKEAKDPTPATLTTPGTPNANEANQDTATALVKQDDYTYQWYQADVGATVTFDPDTATVTGATAIAGEAGKSFDSSKAPGKDIYLVIASKADGNAARSAISNKMTSDYTGIVFINENGKRIENQTADPGYTVKFVSNDETPVTIDGQWEQVETGKYAYVSKDGLTPGKEYTVQVSRANGDAANLVPLAKKLTGTKIGKTLAKPGETETDNFTNVTEADYFTVKAVEFSAKEYKGGTGETFGTGATASTTQSGITPTITFVGDTTNLDGKKVLKDQTITADGGTWTQDYLLDWQMNADNNEANTYTFPNDTTKDVSTAADQASGAASYAHGKVTAQTFIGGRLDQKTYTVTGSVVGVGTVANVVLQGGHGNKTYGTAAGAGVNITAGNSWTDVDNSGSNNAGDTVSFTVVAGTYTITATDGPNTTIQKVTVDGGTAAGTKRNTNTLTAVAGDRAFTIHLEETDLQLGVTDDQAVPDTLAALSQGMTVNNHSHADNVQTIYFDGLNTADPTYALTVSNPGNTDLKVSAAVYKLTPGTDYSNMSAMTLTGPIANTGDGVVTIAGLLPANTDVAKGKMDQAAGTLTLDRSAANTADNIYIIAFTSKVEDTATAGPTVYYILDLTVNPLPIKKVEAVQDSTTKLMTLVDATGAENGLDHVFVDDDGKDDTTPVAANTKGITDADVSFVWAVSDRDDLDHDDFAIVADKMTTTAANTTVDATTGKTRTVANGEQGKYFYLIAYRTDDNKNASDFAVSEAIYAQVTVNMEARRTNKQNAPGKTSSLLDDVNISTTVGGTPVTSNAGTVTVTDPTDNELTFNATMTDVIAKDTTNNPPVDDPTKAEWYFVGWGDTAANFTSLTDLTTVYTVTQKDTVIGYFDKLPDVEAPLGYDKSTGKDVAANRTFTYHPYDGSGKLEKIVISGPTESATPQDYVLNALTFAGTGFSYPAGGFGADGAYVIPEDWIKTTAGLAEGSYTVTFYDQEKGSVAGGYAGYDRVVDWNITEGEKRVTAQVKDTSAAGAAVPEYWGEVTITNGTATKGPGTNGLTVDTVGNRVSLTAAPNAGYVFEKWEVVSGNGAFADTGTTSTTGDAPTFTARSGEVTVQASFKPGTLSMDDQVAQVIYGNQAFEGTAPKMTATSTATGETFTYAFVNAADLAAAGITDADATDAPAWLTLNADGSFAFNGSVDTNVESSDPNTYTAVTNELVVYVKATADKTGETILKKVTIDVKPGSMTVEHVEDTATARGEAYKAANLVDPTNPVIPVDEDGVPMYNETVLKQLFTYVKVVDQAGAVIDATGVAGDAANGDSGVYANGTWTVAPTKFDGSGEPSTYDFTFTYKPGTDEKWNYTAGTTDMTLTIAKPPVGGEFADAIANGGMVLAGTTYQTADAAAGVTGKNSDVPVALVYSTDTQRLGETITFLDTEPTYTVKLKSLDAAIYGVSLNEVKLVGFKVDAYPTFPEGTFASTDGEKSFRLSLDTVSAGKWVGLHEAEFTLTGYASAEAMAADRDRENPTVFATYRLSLEVLPKVITSLDVTTDQPEDTEPKSVTGTLGEDTTPVDLTKPDDTYHITPIRDIEIVPTTVPDGEGTQVSKVDVTVTVDPNYIYTKDDPATPDTTEPDIVDETALNGKDATDPDLTVERDEADGDHTLHISRNIPHLMFHDVKNDENGDPTGTAGAPAVDYTNTCGQVAGNNTLGSYTVNLGAYGADVTNVTIKDVTDAEGTKKLLNSGAKIYKAGAEITLPDGAGSLTAGSMADPAYILDLSGVDTSVGHEFIITLEAEGTSAGGETVKATYTMRVVISNPPPAPIPPSTPDCPNKVYYWLGLTGTTSDATIEDVAMGGKPSKVPSVGVIEGYEFVGWSLTDPRTLKEGQEATLVDPKTQTIKGDTTFYAVYKALPTTGSHKHYVIGYPNGTFGPADNINRASVATIIARAVLPNFVEGADYGNPGGYSDVSGHWAESAIAYCSKFGVFKGYQDGTFRPNQPITRQELATVMARLSGVRPMQEVPFTDIGDAGAWALDGIYTAFDNGIITGYEDGTFKPLNNIRRDETVAMFNRYLNRGVNAEGLADMRAYTHGAGAQGENVYMTWPDVPATQWAYYEIIEAANDHEFTYQDGTGAARWEDWTRSWIDEQWVRHSGASDNGSVTTAMLFAAAPTTGAAEWAGFPGFPPLWVSEDKEVQF